MTSKAYMLAETPITFLSTGGTVLFDPSGTAGADLAGHESAQHDFGTAARPYQFNWRAFCKFATAPTVGDVISIYAKTSDGTHIDNDTGTINAAMNSVDKLENLKLIGRIVVDEASNTVEFVSSGTVILPHRYFQVVWWNSASSAISSTAADNGFILEPVVIQGQDT